MAPSVSGSSTLDGRCSVTTAYPPRARPRLAAARPARAPRQLREQRVDHHVADEDGSRRPDALARAGSRRASGDGVSSRSDSRSVSDAVHLLRHAPVEAAQAGLDVRDAASCSLARRARRRASSSRRRRRRRQSGRSATRTGSNASIPAPSARRGCPDPPRGGGRARGCPGRRRTRRTCARRSAGPCAPGWPVSGRLEGEEHRRHLHEVGPRARHHHHPHPPGRRIGRRPAHPAPPCSIIASLPQHATHRPRASSSGISRRNYARRSPPAHFRTFALSHFRTALQFRTHALPSSSPRPSPAPRARAAAARTPAPARGGRPGCRCGFRRRPRRPGGPAPGEHLRLRLVRLDDADLADGRGDGALALRHQLLVQLLARAQAGEHDRHVRAGLQARQADEVLGQIDGSAPARPCRA